ncbi:hypothetical protein [Nocardiopsis alkaliphila]|uniref:hypothetical protein n=1 Tax=Nocardiopsis alkaliphila TaxID=225762 RepID=UPI00034A89F6|nr:hypothetical protein [Nocardiopsis alkaliphila]
MNFLYALSGLKLSPSLGQEILVQIITLGVVGAIIYLLVADRPMVQLLGMAAILIYSVGRVIAIVAVNRSDQASSTR